MKQITKYFPFFTFPIVVLAAHIIVSGVFDLYTVFPKLDIPFHFIGGLSIAYTSVQILSFLEEDQLSMRLNRVIFLVLIFSITATATVLWEFTEFIVDQLLGTNIQISLANTMQDQFMGILGGVTCIFLYSKRIKIQ